MQTNSHINTYRSWLIDTVCLGVLFLIFYTLWLNSYPLFVPDEGRYSEIAREMIESGNYVTPRINGVVFLDKPIFHYWLQAIAMRLFGIKEWAIRLFPALFGVLGCITVYVCGRRLFDRRTGILSSIILATTPLYFACAHYANLDLEVAVLISCSLLFFLTAIQAIDKSRYYFFFLSYTCAALAFLTKGLIAIAFPVLIISIWVTLLKRWSLLKRAHLFKGIIIFLAITLPWYILAQQENPAFLHFFFITQQISRFLSTTPFNNPTPLWFYLPVILIGFFPWTVFLIQPLSRYKLFFTHPTKHPTESFLLIWALVIFSFFSIPHSKIISYILPIFPPLALLVGHRLANHWHSAVQNKIALYIGLFALGNLIIAALLLTSLDNWMNISINFISYLSAIVVVLIISAIVSLFLIKKEKLVLFFSLCTTANAIFLITLVMGAIHLNSNTTKPLITDLKSIIKPQDEVINYFKFYADVPFYLEQRITLVADWNDPAIPKNDNWVREFWYGMPFQPTSNWLIDETTFWQRYKSDRRVFVFINTNYFNRFKLQAPHYFIIGKYNDVLLLSNKPIILSKNP